MTPVGHVQAMLDKPEPVTPDGLMPIRHGKFELSASGLVVNGNPTVDEWAEVGHVLAVMEHGIQFLVGDWIRFGEERYGEAAAQVIDHRMWSEETVRGYVWLARSVPRENRMVERGLSMKHHQLVAAMPAPQQRVWLRRALNTDGEGPWPAAKLRAAIKGESPHVEATSFYLVVRCKDERDRDALMARMQSEGRECKGTERYEKVEPPKAEAAPAPVLVTTAAPAETLETVPVAVEEVAPEIDVETTPEPEAPEPARVLSKRADTMGKPKGQRRPARVTNNKKKKEK